MMETDRRIQERKDSMKRYDAQKEKLVALKESDRQKIDAINLKGAVFEARCEARHREFEAAIRNSIKNPENLALVSMDTLEPFSDSEPEPEDAPEPHDKVGDAVETDAGGRGGGWAGGCWLGLG